MNTTPLEDAGLTKNESTVYLSLLEIGASSATQIIRKTGLHRAVVYDLLERLIEKALVGYAINGRKKFFEATNPERLKELLQEKAEKLSEILPRLLELSKFQTKLEVKIYKGKEGIKNIFEDILRSKPVEWLSLGSSGETYKALPYFLEHFHKTRIKNKIIARGLLLDTPTARKRGQTLSKMAYSEVRYLKRSVVTPTVMNIYDDRVALYSVNEEKIPFIILIENKEISKSFKEYFEWLWNMST